MVFNAIMGGVIAAMALGYTYAGVRNRVLTVHDKMNLGMYYMLVSIFVVLVGISAQLRNPVP